MIKPTSPLQSCRSRTDFRHARSRSRAVACADAKNNPFRKMHDTLYRERQLRSGNESVEIRYVSGSSVAGTSVSSPGLPRHMLKDHSGKEFSARQSVEITCIPKISGKNIDFRTC